jgi:selenocysteine lyase/cysteine desulfurase
MDLNEVGCDFAGLLSYKWMYAPYASGALFVRKERLDDIRVTYAGGRAEAWADWVNDTFELKPTAERFEYGPWSWPLIHAWAYSMDYLSEIGLDQIWARTVLLTTRLKSGLKEIPGVTLFTPESPDLSAAVQSFHVAGWEVDDVRKELQSRLNIELKSFKTTHHGLRASCPFFLLEEEIDLLLDGVRTLAAEKR